MKKINCEVETEFLRFEDVSFDTEENQLIYDIDESIICIGVAEKTNRSKVDDQLTPILTKNDLVISNAKYSEVGMSLNENDSTIDRRSSFLFLEKAKLQVYADRYWEQVSLDITDEETATFYQNIDLFNVYFGQSFLAKKLLDFRELRLVEKSIFREKIIELKLEELLMYSFQTVCRTYLYDLCKAHMYKNTTIDMLIYLIKEFPEKNWTISELAQRVDMSVVTLNRYFNKAFGLSPHQFVWNHKLQIAQDLLMNRTDLSIADVGNHIGIQRATYFSKVFKKGVGMSPYLYRKKAQIKKNRKDNEVYEKN